MSLLSYFSGNELKTILKKSNYWARKNYNDYPVKMENAINDLYTWEPCTCDDDCECKRHGCESHLVRKVGISFDTYFEYFLQCYVSRSAHNKVRERRVGQSERGYRAVEATDLIRTSWNELNQEISNKSLICTGWSNEAFESITNGFNPGQENIYLSKWMALLSLNIYVAYDNGSVRLLNKDFNNPDSYTEMMGRIRGSLVEHLDTNNTSISDFQNYDEPSGFYDVIGPGPRPIGNIIDKLYLTL